MILYILYKGIGADILQFDLVNGQATSEMFDPGVIGDISNPVTMAVAKIAIKGRPNIYEASSIIGKLQERIKLNNGRGIGPRTYIYYQPAHQDQVYRARIVDMVFVPDGASGGYWADQRFVRGELQILHECWEGELTQIPLTNHNGTNVLTALQVENTTDASGYENFASINGEDIQGDIPTPVKLIIYNSGGNPVPSTHLNQLYIGLNVNSTPASFTHVIEAEDDASASAETVDADYSNAKYTTVTVAGGSNQVVSWLLSAAQMGYANGNLFHIIGAFEDGADARWISYQFFYTQTLLSGTAIYQTQISNLDTSASYKLRELGIIRIPPWKVDETGTSAALYFKAKYLNTTAGPINVTLDAFHLFPADGFRYLQFLAPTYLSVTEYLIDDMIDDKLYWSATGEGVGQSYTVASAGAKINLVPGRDQKLYFLRQDQNDAGSTLYINCSRWLTVKAYYRPRRLTL